MNFMITSRMRLTIFKSNDNVGENIDNKSTNVLVGLSEGISESVDSLSHLI